MAPPRSGDGFQFGKFIIGTDVEQSDVTELATIYRPKIRTSDWIDIPNPVRQDIVIKHPNVPPTNTTPPGGAARCRL